MRDLLSGNQLIKNTVRLNLILATFVILSFNSFAWFVYSTRVDTSIETRVKAWQVEFENNEHEVAHQIKFEIDDLFPGMDDYNNVVNIINYGEAEAMVYFEIQRVKVLENEYTISDYTHEQLLDILSDDFPFKIILDVSNDYLAPNLGDSDFTIDINWPFESGDDALDTFWGNESFLYKQENPGSPGIEVTVELNAVQLIDD